MTEPSSFGILIDIRKKINPNLGKSQMGSMTLKEMSTFLQKL